MDVSIDVIITSFNRPTKVVELVNKIYSDSEISPIIVDSGSNNFTEVQHARIVRSSHKNQPYQRYLGYTVSKAKWLLFLDDDMEPVNGWYQEIKHLASSYPDKGMIGICFRDKHSDTFVNKTPKSIFKHVQNNKVVRFLRSKTGYPILPKGAYYKNGVKGAMPKISSRVEHICGGVFLAQRDSIYVNFNMQLFDLYEVRLGKGEDGILGYTTSKVAPLFYHARQLFWHNDQGNSVYTRNEFQFNKLLAYSRAFLNFEYYRHNSKRYISARWSYANYCFWRLFGLLMNLILKPSKARFNGFLGYFVGCLMGTVMRFDSETSRNSVWIDRALKDSDVQN